SGDGAISTANAPRFPHRSPHVLGRTDPSWPRSAIPTSELAVGHLLHAAGPLPIVRAFLGGIEASRSVRPRAWHIPCPIKKCPTARMENAMPPFVRPPLRPLWPSLLFPLRLVWLVALSALLLRQFWPHRELAGLDPNAAPRAVTGRGDLAQDEQGTIALFREA